MGRTRITLDDHLLAELEQLAARTHRTLTAVVEDALREALTREARANPQNPPVELPTYAGGWVRVGVGIDDSAGLLDIMENPDDPA